VPAFVWLGRNKNRLLRAVVLALCCNHELATGCGAGNRGIDRRNFFIQQI
jgi:hypothetical protein